MAFEIPILKFEASCFAETDMPLYMDIHEVNGATAEDVAKAHIADVNVQGNHGVVYHKYWFNESQGKIFCLCSAPSPEAAVLVHSEAHGLLASKIIEVSPEIADGFLGGCEMNSVGAALVPGGKAEERDPGIRTILFTDIVVGLGVPQGATPGSAAPDAAPGSLAPAAWRHRNRRLTKLSANG